MLEVLIAIIYWKVWQSTDTSSNLVLHYTIHLHWKENYMVSGWFQNPQEVSSENHNEVPKVSVNY